MSRICRLVYSFSIYLLFLSCQEGSADKVFVDIITSEDGFIQIKEDSDTERILKSLADSILSEPPDTLIFLMRDFIDNQEDINDTDYSLVVYHPKSTSEILNEGRREKIAFIDTQSYAVELHFMDTLKDPWFFLLDEDFEFIFKHRKNRQFNSSKP